MKVKVINSDLFRKHSHWDLLRLCGTLGISTARGTRGPKAFPPGNNLTLASNLTIRLNGAFSASCSAMVRTGSGSRGCGFPRTVR